MLGFGLLRASDVETWVWRWGAVFFSGRLEYNGGQVVIVVRCECLWCFSGRAA